MIYMCSLVTNKKTTSKLEYWCYTVLIIIVVCCDVYIIAIKIQSYGNMLDSLNDQMNENLIAYIDEHISQETYESVRNSIGIQQSALENASELDIACVASVVANYLVMMDMIARPIQKLEQEEHLKHQLHTSIHGGFEKNDINYKLLGMKLQLIISAPESDRNPSQRYHRPSQAKKQMRGQSRNDELHPRNS